MHNCDSFSHNFEAAVYEKLVFKKALYMFMPNELTIHNQHCAGNCHTFYLVLSVLLIIGKVCGYV